MEEKKCIVNKVDEIIKQKETEIKKKLSLGWKKSSRKSRNKSCSYSKKNTENFQLKKKFEQDKKVIVLYRRW